MSGIVAYLQYQALLLWLILAAGWTWSGINRRRERLRRRAALTKACNSNSRGGGGPSITCCSNVAINRHAGIDSSCSSIDSKHSSWGSNKGGPSSASTRPMGHGAVTSASGHKGGGGAVGIGAAACGIARRRPPVSVVMPVKGCRPHSLDNWGSHLGLAYNGPLEYVFVVESKDDPAVGPLRALSRRSRGQDPGAQVSALAPRFEPGRGRDRDVRLVVAGLASSCSQKAHNLCTGIESCDPRVGRERGYVFCLDDDVALHPGSLDDLVSELEDRPHVFMATGYPFDIPPPGSSFPTYMALCYHLPLLIAFSAAPDTAFVWGGCMLLRGERLLPGDPGGLLAAWRHGGYSDDLILASYCTERRLGIRVPPFAVFPQRLDPRMTWAAWFNYLHRQLFVLDTYMNDHNRKTNHTMMVLHSVLSWLLVLPSLAALLTLVGRFIIVVAAVVAAAVASIASGSAATTLGAEENGSSSSSISDVVKSATAAVLLPLLQLPGGVVAIVAGWAAAHVALVFMTGEILGLFRQLSPASQNIPLSWFLWGRLWAAMMASNAILPLVMAYAYLSPQVEWAGVLYRKHRGKVTVVRRRERPS